MARSIKKGPFIDDHLLKKVDAARATRAVGKVARGRLHQMQGLRGQQEKYE